MKYELTLAVLLLLNVSPCLAPMARAANEAAEPTGALTMAQSLALVEERNPELRATTLQLNAAEGRVTQAAALLNPTLTVEAENFGGKDEREGFQAAEYTAQLEQSLELGNKRGKRVRVAQLDRKLATFDLESKRLDIRAETARRFIFLLGAQERMALSLESLALAEEFVKAVTARVGAGKVSPMDEDKARILLSQEKVALEATKGQLAVARVHLSAMWGSSNPSFDRVDGDLQALPDTPEFADLAAHLPKNPDVARWATEAEQRLAGLRKEKSARLPDVTLGAGIRRYSETDEQAFVAGISIPLPLFDRNQGNILEAKSLLEQVEKQRIGAEVASASALTETYQALSAALNRIGALKDEVIPRSKSVFAAVQIGYTEGKFAYLDVLDARRTFFDARAEYLEALVEGHQAVTDVERILGGALPVPGKN